MEYFAIRIIVASLFLLFAISPATASADDSLPFLTLQDVLHFLDKERPSCKQPLQHVALTEYSLTRFDITDDMHHSSAMDSFTQALAALLQEKDVGFCIRTTTLPLIVPYKVRMIPPDQTVGGWHWIVVDPRYLPRWQTDSIPMMVAHEVAHITAGKDPEGNAHHSAWLQACNENAAILIKLGYATADCAIGPKIINNTQRTENN